jgi:hypothetical protein
VSNSPPAVSQGNPDTLHIAAKMTMKVATAAAVEAATEKANNDFAHHLFNQLEKGAEPGVVGIEYKVTDTNHIGGGVQARVVRKHVVPIMRNVAGRRHIVKGMKLRRDPPS